MAKERDVRNEIAGALGPLLILLPADVFVNGMDSRTEIGCTEFGSCIMMGREPDVLENTDCMQGKHDKLENGAEEMKM